MCGSEGKNKRKTESLVEERDQRSKNTKRYVNPDGNSLKTVMAYATAEEYDLERLKAGLIKQDLYKPVHLCSGDELKHTGIFFLHTIKSTRAWNLMNIKYCELGRAYLIFF
uniref:Uncharacterized protein n=1 Tax=Timema douglasi TaxID=61478 RepID=A0A7R8VW44_TIMDO|nr:unnamed protein product [Timema douglasi]